MPRLFVPKERRPYEARVAATPETVKRLQQAGLAVAVETGAGSAAGIVDDAFRAAGATIGSAWDADVILKVAPPTLEEAGAVRKGAIVVGHFAAERNVEVVERLREQGATALAMERVPRITRAQKMDALSSQANIAGYKAALLAAARLDKYFPLLMTAAGTVQPARVVVMGAGVAGLSAVATARRLGAVVEVSDVRPAAKEQVESLGGRFIDLPEEMMAEGQGGYAKELGSDVLAKQQEIVARHVAHADVVITTALVPGRPAPRLVTRAMVESMRPGAVIVDLAVEQGGNCELSKPGEEVLHDGVVILGPPNLAATMPADASLLYARNVLEVVRLFCKDGELRLDPKDEILGAMLLAYEGRLVHGPAAGGLKGATG